MNNFLKHNLEMPLTGGVSGGSGGSSKPTLLGDGLQPGDTVMSITGADKDGNFLTDKNFVERNIDLKVNPTSYPDLNGVLEQSGAQKTLFEGLLDSVELDQYKIAIPIRYDKSSSQEKIFLVFDNNNSTIDKYVISNGNVSFLYQNSLQGMKVLDDLGNPEIAENIYFDVYNDGTNIQMVFYSNRSSSTMFLRVNQEFGDYNNVSRYNQLPFNPKGIWLTQADKTFYVMDDSGDIYKADFLSGALQMSSVLFSPSVDLNDLNLTSEFQIARDRNGLFQNSCQLVDEDRLFIPFYELIDDNGDTLCNYKATSIYLKNDGYATLYFPDFDRIVENFSGVDQTFNATINGTDVYPGGFVIPDGGYVSVSDFIMQVQMNVPDVFADESGNFPLIQSFNDSFLDITFYNPEGGLSSYNIDIQNGFFMSSFLPADFNNTYGILMTGLNTDKTVVSEIEANRFRFDHYYDFNNEKLGSIFFRVDDATNGNQLCQFNVLKMKDSYTNTFYNSNNMIAKFSNHLGNPFDDRLAFMFSLTDSMLSSLSGTAYSGFYNFYHNGEHNEAIIDVSEAGGETNYVRVKFNKNHKDIMYNDFPSYNSVQNYDYIDKGIFENNAQNQVYFSLGVNKGVYNYMTFKNINPLDPKDLYAENGFVLNNYDGSFDNFSFLDFSDYYSEQAVVFYNDSSFIMPKLNNGVDRYFTKHTYD